MHPNRAFRFEDDRGRARLGARARLRAYPRGHARRPDRRACADRCRRAMARSAFTWRARNRIVPLLDGASVAAERRGRGRLYHAQLVCRADAAGADLELCRGRDRRNAAARSTRRRWSRSSTRWRRPTKPRVCARQALDARQDGRGPIPQDAGRDHRLRGDDRGDARHLQAQPEQDAEDIARRRSTVFRAPATRRSPI